MVQSYLVAIPLALILILSQSILTLGGYAQPVEALTEINDIIEQVIGSPTHQLLRRRQLSDFDLAECQDFENQVMQCTLAKAENADAGSFTSLCDIVQFSIDVTYECYSAADESPCKDFFLENARCSDVVAQIEKELEEQGESCSLNCPGDLSAGAVAGIVVGALAAVGLGVGLFCCLRKR